MRPARLLLIAVAALLGCVAPAAAHTRSETHSDWRISGSTVRMAFTVPDLEAKRLAPEGGAPPSDAALGAYLARHVGVQAGTAACPLLRPPEPVAAVQGVRRFEFLFECPNPKGIKVSSSAFFALVPTHTNFAQIQTDKGDFIEQLITKDAQTIDLAGGAGGELNNASFLRYVELGVMHIFTGIDHQTFLVGLILLSRRLRDLTFVITGFTLGHSLTLALAVTGVLRPHAEYIDALIGLTIALVGAEVLITTTARPRTIALAAGGLLLLMALGQLLGLGGLPLLLLLGGGLFASGYLTVAGRLQDAGRLRLVVTLVFGLIHGFGFAADLLEMKLPTARLAELLVGFNLGVELGQLTLVLAVTGLAALLVRTGFALPRRLVADLGAAALIGVGLYWFAARSYA